MRPSHFPLSPPPQPEERRLKAGGRLKAWPHVGAHSCVRRPEARTIILGVILGDAVRILQSKAFARFARQAGITDAALCRAIRDAERGLIAAELGGGVI